MEKMWICQMQCLYMNCLRAETAYHGRRRDLSAHRVDGTAVCLSLRCLHGHLQRGRTKQDSVLHQRNGTDYEYPPRPSVHLRLRLGNSGRGTCHMAFRSYSIRHLRLQTPGEKRRARRFLLYRSAEKEVHPAHLQARAARGYAEHAICLRQHVPLAHRLGAPRSKIPR